MLLDGRPVLSCLVLAADLNGRAIETVEGLQQANELHPLQSTFADLSAAQCGYCTPALLMTAKALLEADPRPDEQTIREALSGTLCRCTGYHKIIQAVEGAAALLAGEDWEPPQEVLFGSPLPAGTDSPSGDGNGGKADG